MYDRGLRRLLPLPHHLPNPPRPRRLGPLPRCGVAAPRLLRAARPAHRAGGARGAARADDDPPRLVWPLRPSPAASAGDAAHLALRLGQRRSRLPPPLPLRSLSPVVLGTLTAFAADRVFVYFAPAGGLDAETTKRRDRNPGPRSAGSEFRDPVVAGKCLKQQAEGEERSASSQGARKVASRWSRSSAKGRCREGSAEEGSGCDLGFEGEDRSPPSEASAWSRASARIEEEGGLRAKAEEPWTQ